MEVSARFGEKRPNLGVGGQGGDGVLGVLDVGRQERQDVERLLGERRQRVLKQIQF